MASVLQLLGIAVFLVGVSLIAPFLGFIFGGIALIYLGFAVDPPQKEVTRE